MTNKELKKLSKTELLEVLVYMRKEIDSLKDENQRLTEQLEQNNINKQNEEMLKLLKENSEKLDVFFNWLMAEDEGAKGTE